MGGGFLLAFIQYVAYNGFGDIFEYVKSEHLETRVEIDSIKETKTIFYEYTVDKKEYESKQSIHISRIAARDFLKVMCIIRMVFSVWLRPLRVIFLTHV